MSSIIKGQRIRSESTLEIENTAAYIAAQEVNGNPTLDPEELEQDLRRKIEGANSEATMIIQGAEEEAIARVAMIIKEGQDKITMESAIALEEAQKEGYQAGYDQGQLEAKTLVDEGKQILLDAKDQKQQILDDMEPEIIEMIIRICGKLIDEEINYNKDTILLLIRKALGQVSSDILEVSIKVSSEEYDYVLDNKQLISKGGLNTDHIQIKKDPNLNKGVCVIETSLGSIECNVDEAFEEIKQQMRLIYSKK